VEKNTERWKELAEQASQEQDPNKLLELVREINQLLEQKERRLRGMLRDTEPTSGAPPPSSRSTEQ
jgi:hypothetical protein